MMEGVIKMLHCKRARAVLLFTVFFVLQIAGSFAPAWAREVLVPQNARVSPMVLARAKKGETQEVMVTFEADHVLHREKERLTTNESDYKVGRGERDKATRAETKRELRLLREAAFAELNLPGIEVLEHYEEAAVSRVLVRSESALNRLLRHPQVKSVWEVEIFRPQLVQSLSLIRQPAALAAGAGGSETRIAVLDTGIDAQSELFSRDGRWGACIPPGYTSAYGRYALGKGDCAIANFVNFSGGEDCVVGYNCSHHGTSTSAIALSVAPRSSIAMLQIVSRTGVSNSAIIMRAMDWVIANVDSGEKIVAMNLSLGTGGIYTAPCIGHPFEEYFARARNVGIVPVVASGNEGQTGAISAPACAGNAVSVGAVYDENRGNFVTGYGCSDATAIDKVACFSNSADFLTLLAPGSYIKTGGFAMSGTSQAAPHVAGAAAVLRSRFPSDPVAWTVSRLVANGVAIKDWRNGVVKPRLNLDAALNGPIGDFPSGPTIESISALSIIQSILLAD